MMTPRQKQALDYRKAGLSLKQIAGRLGISTERARQLVIQARWNEMGRPRYRGPWTLSSRLEVE
jgi:hypothetical protein